MATNEEIYSVILKLREEMSTPLGKAQQALGNTTKEADKASKGFDIMRNQVGRLRSILLTTFGVGGGVALVTNAIRGWFDHQQRVNDEIRKSAEALPTVRRELDLVTQAIERMNVEIAKRKFGVQDEADLAKKLGFETFLKAYIDKRTWQPDWLLGLPTGASGHSTMLEKLTKEATAEFERLTNAAKQSEEATQRALQMAGVASNVMQPGLGPYVSKKKSYEFVTAPTDTGGSPFFTAPFSGFSSASGGFAAFNATLPGQIYAAQQKSQQAAAQQKLQSQGGYTGMGGGLGILIAENLKFQASIIQAQGSVEGFKFGFSKAVQEMRAQAQNLAMLGEEAGAKFSSALTGNIETFLNTLALGKASFKDFARSVILDIIGIINHMVAMQLASKFLSFLPTSFGGAPGAGGGGYQFGTPIAPSMYAGGGVGGSRGGLTVVHVHGLSGAEVMAALSTAPGVRAVRSITAAGMTSHPGFRSAMLGAT